MQCLTTLLLLLQLRSCLCLERCMSRSECCERMCCSGGSRFPCGSLPFNGAREGLVGSRTQRQQIDAQLRVGSRGRREHRG